MQDLIPNTYLLQLAGYCCTNRIYTAITPCSFFIFVTPPFLFFFGSKVHFSQVLAFVPLCVFLYPNTNHSYPKSMK